MSQSCRLPQSHVFTWPIKRHHHNHHNQVPSSLRGVSALVLQRFRSCCPQFPHLPIPRCYQSSMGTTFHTLSFNHPFECCLGLPQAYVFEMVVVGKQMIVICSSPLFALILLSTSSLDVLSAFSTWYFPYPFPCPMFVSELVQYRCYLPHHSNTLVQSN